MSESLLVGIDGGGTQCRARIATEDGKVLGEGVGGPANARLDPALVMGSILQATRAAAAAAGVSEPELAGARAGFGLAGANLKSAVTALLAEPNPFGPIAVDTDAYAAWLGAHGGADGAIFISGTGSCGFAVVAGQPVYVGGWGAEISDEASGTWIGREALRRAMWAHDGRAPHGTLSKALLAKYDDSAEKVIGFATMARPADYARFVPLVLAHAETADPLAMTLLAEAGADAARIVTRLLEAGAPEVCIIGGLSDVITAWLPPPLRARLAAPKGDAMDGALIMARRAAAA